MLKWLRKQRAICSYCRKPMYRHFENYICRLSLYIRAYGKIHGERAALEELITRLRFYTAG